MYWLKRRKDYAFKTPSFNGKHLRKPISFPGSLIIFNKQMH